jgi:hypothetical protein
VPTFEEAIAARNTADKLKAQKGPLSPDQQQTLDAAEKTFARRTEQNILNQQAGIEKRGGKLHPTTAKALADAQAILARPGPGGKPGNSRPADNTTSVAGTLPEGRPASGSSKVQAAWKPSNLPDGSTNRVAADEWHKRLNAMRNMTNPITVGEAISWRPEHPVTPDLERKIFTATQTFLDMLPRNLVKDLGRVKLSVKWALDEGAAGAYDYKTDTMTLSYQKIKEYTTFEILEPNMDDFFNYLINNYPLIVTILNPNMRYHTTLIYGFSNDGKLYLKDKMLDIESFENVFTEMYVIKN